MQPEAVPLIAHVVHRLDYGGLENGVVNLINRLPESRFRHAVVCLTGHTEFRERIKREVRLVALKKRPGRDPGIYLRLLDAFRQIRPDLVHTRNLATIEAQVPAALAGVRARLHGDHGWGALDLGGASRKYRRLRRLLRPLVQRYVPLSAELEEYLREEIRVPPQRITRICNGVDTDLFRPRHPGETGPWPAGFAPPGTVVLGTVGRMEKVKDPLNLVEAFLRLRRAAELGPRLRLVMVGDGSLRQAALGRLAEAGATDAAWLPGPRDDVPRILRCLDLFVLPSRSEGISNAALEAMACGVALIATRVGGNPELMVEGHSAALVPPANPEALAAAVERFATDAGRRSAHGSAARERAVRSFSLDIMVERYAQVYDELLGRRL